MEDKKVVIKLDKYEWADEIEARRIRRWRILSLILGGIALFVLGMGVQTWLSPAPMVRPVPESTDTPRVQTIKPTQKFEGIYDILLNNWYFAREMKNPSEELIDHAITGMIKENQDIHTEYMTKEEVDRFNESINRSFVGIGVSYYQVEGYAIVQKVFNNSPAAKAGVLAGDIIHKVDGVSVINEDVDSISSKVRGEKGSPVTIEFLRDSQPVEITIVRDTITSTAFAKMVDDETGYLEISSFGQDTGKEVAKDLLELKKQGAKKLIIDLRDNGGGFLNALNDIANLFLKEGQIILQQEYKDGSIQTSKAQGDPLVEFERIILLINQNSASAAEVLTAALKENLDNVDLVGVKTYGKGTVQVQAPFTDGSTLKYTVAQWLTPKGNKIHHKGIEPTVEVKQHPIFYQTFEKTGTDQENFSIGVDSVSPLVAYGQKALDFLGYAVDRFDGYYSKDTESALKAYQESVGLDQDGLLTQELLSLMISSVNKEWHLHKDVHDLQYLKALDLLKVKTTSHTIHFWSLA